MFRAMPFIRVYVHIYIYIQMLGKSGSGMYSNCDRVSRGKILRRNEQIAFRHLGTSRFSGCEEGGFRDEGFDTRRAASCGMYRWGA